MAQKTEFMELHGTVLEGDYKGLNVYRWNESSFVITEGRISRGPGADNWSIVQEITKETVERYQVLSSYGQDNSFVGMLHNRFVGGTANHQMAIYFKNEKKCIIEIYYDAAFNDIQRVLFTL